MNKFLLKTKIVETLLSIKKRTRRISPLFIARALDISIEEAVLSLNQLVEDNILEQIYCVRCDDCQYTFLYENYDDIPIDETITCKNGHQTIIYKEKIQLWYKINKEELNEFNDDKTDKKIKKKEMILVYN
ncbi:hypothetical protein HUZ99_04395 [Staphylococcus sp. SS87]|nr:hypothetical protein [Staphylococcus singaporensis]